MFCMCGCWCVCALMWVGVFPWVYTYGGQKSTSGGFLFCFPPYLWRRASSMNWKLSVSARLAEYYTPGIFLSLPHPIPTLGLQAVTVTPRFYLDTGIQAQVLTLAQ